MKPRIRLLCALLTAALPAVAAAEAYLYQPANALGYYYDDNGVLLNQVGSQHFPTGDGSNYRYVTCVGSEPGQPGCSVINPPPDPQVHWYQQPNLPASAAAQAWSPDYGISRVRTWSRGTNGVNTGDPGFTVYSAAAQAGWRDEINTSSATPVVITFIVQLHVEWNDGGLFAYQMGRPGHYDPKGGGSTPMVGWTWTNCADCQLGYGTGDARTVLPGGADGQADLIVTHSFTVLPDSFGDPEDPNPFTNPFETVLSAYSVLNDAEVNAYSTATLLAIQVPPDAGLTFASGHAYNVQVVPEPATWALWAGGLLAMLWKRRVHVRAKAA